MTGRSRRVDQFTGEIANTQFFKALSEADQFCADLDALRDQRDELLIRVQELEAELSARNNKFHQ